MKVLYDHQVFEFQIFGGISRYFYELFQNDGLIDGFEAELSLMQSKNNYLKYSAKYCQLVNGRMKRDKNFLLGLKFAERDRIYFHYNRISGYLKKNEENSKDKLRAQNFNIFHPTYFDPYFLNYLGKKPFVLTVYDMIHEKFNSQYNSNDKTSLNKKLLCEKASKIIAISQSTKNDIVNLFNIDAEKIEVIYLANSLLNDSEEKIETLPRKFLLFVGNRGGYKNFEKLVKGISKILQEDESLFLVCTGPSFETSEIDLFTLLGVQKNVIHFFVSDKQLCFLYKNALAFIFPSLYEGFGIPTLEAFACGCPVILSNTSSMPEVGGEAALYIDPNDEMDIYDKVREVVVNAGLRSDLIRRGFKQNEKFTWNKCIKEHYSLYKELIK